GGTSYIWSGPNGFNSTDQNSTITAATTAATGTYVVIVTDGNNCSATTSTDATVNPNANAGTVSGTATVCITGTTSLNSSGDAGGSWSSSDPTVATVDAATGDVTGVSAGTTDITYIVSTGCNSPVSSAPFTVTVSSSTNGNAGTVSGTSPLCIG